LSQSVQDHSLRRKKKSKKKKIYNNNNVGLNFWGDIGT
jgi:hypothetical protein